VSETKTLSFLATNTQVGNYHLAESAFIAACQPFATVMGEDAQLAYLYSQVDSYIWDVPKRETNTPTLVPIDNRHTPKQKAAFRKAISLLVDYPGRVLFGEREVEFRNQGDRILVRRQETGEILIFVELGPKETEAKASMIRQNFGLDFEEKES